MARRHRHLTWLLILVCVAGLAFCALAFAAHPQSTSACCLDQSDGPALALGDAPCILLAWDTPPHFSGLAWHLRAADLGLLPDCSIAPSLLACDPGGLCLLR